MERPILFSGEMVRAILEGRKTQTRRVIKPQPKITGTSSLDRFEYWGDKGWLPTSPSGKVGIFNPMSYKCPYGVPGDTLWVRHSFYQYDSPHNKANSHIWDEYNKCARWKTGEAVNDIKPDLTEGWRKRPSIHMPRWASRINLLVKDIRVERVQEISSDKDLEGEGIETKVVDMTVMAKDYSRKGDYWFQDWIDYGDNSIPYVENAFLASFVSLWDSINAKRGHGWDTNPWVWVVEFERIK